MLDGAHNPAGARGAGRGAARGRRRARRWSACSACSTTRTPPAMLARAAAARSSASSSPARANPRALSPGARSRASPRKLARAAGRDRGRPARGAGAGAGAGRTRTAPCSSPARSTWSPIWSGASAAARAIDALMNEREYPSLLAMIGARRRRGRGRDPGVLRHRLPVRPAVPLVDRGLGLGSSGEVDSGHSGTMGLLAIFGIHNDGLNLVVNLLILFLVVIWLALIYWTYLDARRRIADPMLVGLRDRRLALPVHRHGRLRDRAPAGVPRGRARARAGDRSRRGAAAPARPGAAPTASTRSRRTSCAARAACAGSRSPARPAASRSTRAGRSAPTARPRSRSADRASRRRRSARDAPRRRQSRRLHAAEQPAARRGRHAAARRGGAGRQRRQRRSRSQRSPTVSGP